MTKQKIDIPDSAHQQLTFNEEILSTVSNPIATKHLITRLKDLQQELSAFEQEKVDLSSLNRIKDTLSHKKLIKHANRGVQVYVACCLADILRLYAPDAPYNDSDLISIFKLFIQQLQYLSETDSPFYNSYVYLLERIAEVKLVALMTDLSNNDKLINEFFETFFALTNQKSVNLEALQPYFIDILNEIINEVNHLDIKTLKLIFNKFLANSKNMKNQSAIKVPGFEISLALCEINSDKISRLVTYFFSELILDATKNAESDSEVGSASESESEDESSTKKFTNIDLVQMKKIHTLATELWRYVPEILPSVMGLLDNELETEDVRIRMIATDTVSKMLQVKNSRVNFPTAYVETYMNWLKKPLDISIDIRITWINGLSRILENRTDINNDILDGLLKTLIDSHDKVRLSTIIELSKLRPATFLNNVFIGNLSSTLIKLLREKNPAIRNEIIQFLSALYNVAIDDEEFKDNSFVTDIPSQILSLVYINDKAINAEIDLAFFEKIVPFNPDPLYRTTRFLSVFSSLTEKARSALLAITKRQTQLSKVILHLLSIIEDDDDFEKENKLNNAIKWLSRDFPAQYNFESSLHAFIQLNNKRLLRLLKLCASENSDYDTIVNSMKELLNKLGDLKIMNAIDLPNVSVASLTNSIKLLLLRVSNIYYNISNVYPLIEINADSMNRHKETSKIILNDISSICPNVLAPNMTLLANNICVKAKDIQFDQMRTHNDIYKDLKVIANYLNHQSHINFNDDFYDCLYELSIKGSIREAKYSIRIINQNLVERRLYFTKLVSKVWPLDRSSLFFNTHLSSLSEIFLCDVTLVENIKDDLSKYLASEILLKNHVSESDKVSADDHEPQWIDNDDLYYGDKNKECLSKLLTIKLLTNWLINIQAEDMEEVESTSKPILSMLSSFINRGGEIVPTENTPPGFCARLRLHSGIQLLKLSEIPIYDKFIDQRRLNRLIVLIQDIELEVRKKFLEKLTKRLTKKDITDRFLPLVFFTSHEPDLSLKLNTSTWIKASFSKQITDQERKSSLTFEKAYVRSLYMLYNHTELKELYVAYKSLEVEQAGDLDIEDGKSNENETAKAFKELTTFALTTIVFSLSLILTPDNASLLYYLSQRIKQYASVPLTPNEEPADELLYLVSEFSQTSIKSIGKLRNWNITTWPSTLNLPADLFTKLTSDEASSIIKKSYIPDKFTHLVEDEVRARWRKESGFGTGKKLKTTNVNVSVSNSINTDTNTVQVNNNKRKVHQRKRQRDAAVDKDDDDESDYETPTKSRNTDIGSNSRRSARSAKRVNYTED